MINMPPNGFLLSGNLQALRWVDIFLAVLHAFIYTVFFLPHNKIHIRYDKEGILHAPHGFAARDSQAELATGPGRGCRGCTQACALTLLSRCSHSPGALEDESQNFFYFP